MTSTPDATETLESTPAPKKQISAKRRIISWIFIAILLSIVLFEWHAKSSQAKTVASMEAAMEHAGPSAEFPYEEIETFKQGMPSEEINEDGAIYRQHHYRWNGVFKTYDLRVLVDDKEMVVSFDTLSDGQAVGGIRRIMKKNLEALKAKNKKRAEAAAKKATPKNTADSQ